MVKNRQDAETKNLVLPSILTLGEQWQRVKVLIFNAWSVTNLGETEVSTYAENLMLKETRKGIVTMSVLVLLTQISAVVLYYRFNFHESFFYTCGLLVLLSLHIVVSAKFVNGIPALNLLSTMLLIITSVAIMTIAHRTGTMHAGLMANIVLLFMVMPLMPWGLREAGITALLIYTLFTFSSLSVEGRFDSETLWTMQFLIIASATIAIFTIMRNTLMRKNDICTRFELENAHSKLQLLSTRDPLTGAWNRRYLDQNFDEIAQTTRREGKVLQLAVLDVDSFKFLNDTFGHHLGDEVLKRLTNIFTKHLPGNAHLIRLGGDEFAVLYSGDKFEEIINRCLRHLQTDPALLKAANGMPVLVSTGYASIKKDETPEFEAVYKRADEQLYATKKYNKKIIDTQLLSVIRSKK